MPPRRWRVALRLAAYVRNNNGDKTDVMARRGDRSGHASGRGPERRTPGIEYRYDLCESSGERAALDKARLSSSAGHAPLLTRTFRLSGGTWCAPVVRDAKLGSDRVRDP